MSIWDMSIMVSGMILMVMGIRVIGKKRLPRGLILCLWNLVLIRGILPFQISLGEIPVWDHSGNPLPEWNRYEELEKVLEMMSTEAGAGQTGQRPISVGSSYVQAETVLNWIWITGIACLLLYFLYTYVKEYQAFRKCVPVQNEIARRMIRKRGFIRKIRLYEGEAFQTPVTYGVLFPKIVLPIKADTVSRLDLRNMIAHELEHIRKFDVFKRYILAVFLCLHWFNPLAWLLYRLYQEDQEIACDERVLRQMKGKRGKNYIYTMIKMSADGKRHFAATGFGGKSVGKRRVLAALHPKRVRISNMAIILSTGICMSLVFITVTPIREERQAQAGGAESITEKDSSPKVPLQLIAPVFEDNSNLIWYNKNFDYQGIMQDIRENYNDVTQPLTEEQARAVQIQNYLILGEYYKGVMENGIDLNSNIKSEAIWMIDEYYGRYNYPLE